MDLLQTEALTVFVFWLALLCLYPLPLQEYMQGSHGSQNERRVEPSRTQLKAWSDPAPAKPSREPLGSSQADMKQIPTVVGH